MYTSDSFALKPLNAQERRLLIGGKAAGLYEMTQAGLNVPAFLVFGTDAYKAWKLNPEMFTQTLYQKLPDIKGYFIERFGYMPLLSVRSGAPVSCPGMMDTLLNVGIDNQTFKFWKNELGSECVRDCVGRFAEMYGTLVLGVQKEKFEHLSAQGKARCMTQALGGQMPSVDDQIAQSILTVFASWDNERAQEYRKIHSIPDFLGTACTLQAMVFGNRDEDSCTGVLFTRDPNTGAKGICGEYLRKAQGEDIVAGTTTPRNLSELETESPALFQELVALADQLEAHYRDVQDIEFTVQSGTLYVLQTRAAKRTARASLKIAVDLYQAGVLDQEEVIHRVSTQEYAEVRKHRVILSGGVKVQGIAASFGVAQGKPVFSSAEAVEMKKQGIPCILVTEETCPNDIAGMHAAEGIVTRTGGYTCHASVVARGMNKPCVVGLVDVSLADFQQDRIALDGATGAVHWGDYSIETISGAESPELKTFDKLVSAVTGCYPFSTRPVDATLFCLDLSKSDLGAYYPKPSPYAYLPKSKWESSSVNWLTGVCTHRVSNQELLNKLVANAEKEGTPVYPPLTRIIAESEEDVAMLWKLGFKPIRTLILNTLTDAQALFDMHDAVVVEASHLSTLEQDFLKRMFAEMATPPILIETGTKTFNGSVAFLPRNDCW